MSSEGSRFLAEMLATGRYRGRRTGGLIDRLPGTDMSGDRTQRLNQAMARFEAASRAGDEIARDIADREIDRILDEGRAARQPATVEHEPPAPPPVSFDGGVRRAFVRQQTSMNGFIGRALNPWTR